MREMRTSERIGLISSAVGAVLTLAVGTGLSLVLNGFVEGFLVLGALGLSALLVSFFWSQSAHRERPPLVHSRDDTQA